MKHKLVTSLGTYYWNPFKLSQKSSISVDHIIHIHELSHDHTLRCLVNENDEEIVLLWHDH